MQTSGRKCLPGGSSRDLWLVTREGSPSDVDLALALLKKSGGNVNARNSVGLTPLHIATWRNHIPIVRRLLAAGADPNARDGESGWSSLHRALHFGHLAVASVLFQSSASIILEDSKLRTPIDLLSGPVLQVVGDGDETVATEVFSWGSGVNYQLGTGNAHIQKLPCKVDALHGSLIKLISAAKFHSVAVTARGEVYTWGFGRGGRLGHPDFDIHSGQAAVITPRQVISGLGSRRVKTIAAAKHHTVAATQSGEVFTWGSNREGQLGYTSVDTQPTPRRVSSLKSRIVAVAAANKHTAVISDLGEVFTWGCNKEGQLGYGTSNSASNYSPRLVESLKGKVLISVAAAKYHTIVLGTDGEVFTWGHRLVTPRRVVIARNIKKGGSSPLKFHRMERLHVASIAAGVTHSVALTDDGALFFWVSSDPNLRCQQLHSLCGRNIVSISAGKYWTAAVTDTGDVLMWDGKKRRDEPPIITRLHGLKKATSVSVGETHLLIVSSLYHPLYPTQKVGSSQKVNEMHKSEKADELDEGFVFDDVECEDVLPTEGKEDFVKTVPSLKALCERVAIEHLLEPRNSLQLLEIADSLGADDLRKHCEEMALRNLDYILAVSTQTFTNTSLDILLSLEKLLDLKSSEPWSHRRLPTPTATYPAIINSEEDDSENEFVRPRDSSLRTPPFQKEGPLRLDNFLQCGDGVKDELSKQVRALRKKLQQIEMLEDKLLKGHSLDDQQLKKIQSRGALESSLNELGVPMETVHSNASSSASMDGRSSKKGASRKQRRKTKQTAAGDEESSVGCEEKGQPESAEIIEEVETPHAKDKDKAADLFRDEMKQACADSSRFIKDLASTGGKSDSSPSASKKKKNRKGGLSMFLSGGLDDVPKCTVPSPAVVKSEGPAWGGAKISKGSSSLRAIQDEQSRTMGIKPTKVNNLPEEVSDGNNTTKIRLGSFLHSSPIPVVSARTSQASDGERNTPPWAASGTPPSLSRPSLRDIQVQQGKQYQTLGSPTTRTTGFAVTAVQGSPSDSSMNRWFKPEADTPSSIRSIQIEEKAIKDLKRFYSSVKVVRNPS
ncbi:OLC1v1033941C1 [Oldenlandia corymbosa var. corymbosa]|uniref:OLC1v1033941C1 n=1 Tax=Oldenlandia corymbosa var. corymbosa TaxID=529605 RepID=A0AAV1CS93_OLDCO|nr:OLC1v1033941C1 [Oldenlandia corymbosa var. corymbosa]